MAADASNSGAGFVLELEGAEEALPKLAAVLDRTEKPAPLFDIIGSLLVASTVDRFERESDPEGNPWPPSIRVLLEGGKTLTDSAFLRNAQTHEADDQGVAVGSNVLYAGTHQFGADIRPVSAKALAFEIGGQLLQVQKVTIPPRPFLGLSEEDEAMIEEEATAFILGPVEGADAR